MVQHKWDKVNTLVTLMVFLTEVGPSRQLDFLDAECLRSYHCDQPGIPCQVKTYQIDCPIQDRESLELTPSAPQKFEAEIAYTFNNVTEKCEGSPTISWIPPNTAGANTLTGFMVALQPYVHGFSNMKICVVLDLSGTNWTQELIESEPAFTFDCFRTPKSGRYFITLNSLPLPQDCCERAVRVLNSKYQYDSASETCRLIPTTTTTTTTPTTPTSTNTKEVTTTTTKPDESSTVTVNHHSSTPAHIDPLNSSFRYKDLAIGLGVLLGITIVVVVIFIYCSRRRSGEASRTHRLNNINKEQNQHMLDRHDVHSYDITSSTSQSV